MSMAIFQPLPSLLQLHTAHISTDAQRHAHPKNEDKTSAQVKEGSRKSEPWKGVRKHLWMTPENLPMLPYLILKLYEVFLRKLNWDLKDIISPGSHIQEKVGPRFTAQCVCLQAHGLSNRMGSIAY